jgi:hypothetical protein
LPSVRTTHSSFPTSWSLATLALLLVSAAYSLWSYWFLFGGDPEIHLVFARNLLDGYPLQFNKGEFSSGETSPVYMLAVALMVLFAGDSAQIAMKLTGLASLAGICVVIFLEARSRSGSIWNAATIALFPLALPSMVFQASLGMENCPFAFCVVLVLHLWLRQPHGSSPVARIVLSAFLPVLFFLRPEAVFLLGCLALLAIYDRQWPVVASLGAAAAIILIAYHELEVATGVPFHAAGVMRVELSRLESTVVPILGTSFYLSTKPAVAILYALPLAALAVRYRKTLRLLSHETIVFVTLFFAPLILHALVLLPTNFFSRYFLYAYAALFWLLARFAAKNVVADLPFARQLFLCALPICVIFAPLEHYKRSIVALDDVRDSLRLFARKNIAQTSADLYAALGHPPTPVAIALEEVQIRGLLDDRFIVRSLDGIVDYALRDYVHQGWIDHIGYLKARNVTFVLETPDYNSDKTRFALAKLEHAKLPAQFNGACIERRDFAKKIADTYTHAFVLSHRC